MWLDMLDIMAGMTIRLWLARLLIGLVLMVNVQCAFVFIAWPAQYAPGFGLQGVAGDAVVRGFGVLFLMWNVPYVLALVHPRRQRVSLFEALAMQTIGLVGESLIWQNLPVDFVEIRYSVLRFIIFDGAGLLALCLATWVIGIQGTLKGELE